MIQMLKQSLDNWPQIRLDINLRIIKRVLEL